MIPGSNLLNQALTLIASQPFVYLRNTGRTTTATGQNVAQFAPGVELRGSVQAIPLYRYEALGLDLTKRYVVVYASVDVLGVSRDRSGDQFTFNGKRYNVTQETPWHFQDGWTGFVGLEIGNA